MRTLRWMLGFSLVLVACDRHDEPGQTVTTAADRAVAATERTAERAADAGARELKREWENLDVHVTSGDTPVLGARDGGVTLKKP